MGARNAAADPRGPASIHAPCASTARGGARAHRAGDGLRQAVDGLLEPTRELGQQTLDPAPVEPSDPKVPNVVDRPGDVPAVVPVAGQYVRLADAAPDGSIHPPAALGARHQRACFVN